MSVPAYFPAIVLPRIEPIHIPFTILPPVSLSDVDKAAVQAQLEADYDTWFPEASNPAIVQAEGQSQEQIRQAEGRLAVLRADLQAAEAESQSKRATLAGLKDNAKNNETIRAQLEQRKSDLRDKLSRKEAEHGALQTRHDELIQQNQILRAQCEALRAAIDKDRGKADDHLTKMAAPVEAYTTVAKALIQLLATEIDKLNEYRKADGQSPFTSMKDFAGAPEHFLGFPDELTGVLDQLEMYLASITPSKRT
jgi:DNA repair exonuclease SbcCD ATPase subunit